MNEVTYRLSERPNIAFVYCRRCHRLHIMSHQKLILCPQQPSSPKNNNNSIAFTRAIPMAFLFFPRPLCSFRIPSVTSFSSLLDRPPTPYSFCNDTDEENINEDDKHNWVDVMHSPGNKSITSTTQQTMKPDFSDV